MRSRAQAQAAGRARWAGTTAEQRQSFAQVMIDARYTKEQRQRATNERDRVQALRDEPCVGCGGPVGRAGRKHCGAPLCVRAHKAARMRAYWQTEKGREVKRRLKTEERARRKAMGLPAVPYNEASKARYQRRRAAKKGVGAEDFLNSEIFDRDGWVCGICEQPVDPTLAYPDPMSVSLDHLVPLSLGGEHSRANTRCSHLTCNVRRGNRAA